MGADGYHRHAARQEEAIPFKCFGKYGSLKTAHTPWRTMCREWAEITAHSKSMQMAAGSHFVGCAQIKHILHSLC